MGINFSINFHKIFKTASVFQKKDEPSTNITANTVILNEALKLHFIMTGSKHTVVCQTKPKSFRIDIRNDEKINKQEFGPSRVDEIYSLSDNSAVSFTYVVSLIASTAKLS